MYSIQRDIILEALGWTVDCESPYEISHFEGSFASGWAARIVVDELMRNWRDEFDEDEILEIEKKLERK